MQAAPSTTARERIDRIFATQRGLATIALGLRTQMIALLGDAGDTMFNRFVNVLEREHSIGSTRAKQYLLAVDSTVQKGRTGSAQEAGEQLARLTEPEVAPTWKDWRTKDFGDQRDWTAVIMATQPTGPQPSSPPAAAPRGPRARVRDDEALAAWEKKERAKEVKAKTPPQSPKGQQPSPPESPTTPGAPPPPKPKKEHPTAELEEMLANSASIIKAPNTGVNKGNAPNTKDSWKVENTRPKEEAGAAQKQRKTINTDAVDVARSWRKRTNYGTATHKATRLNSVDAVKAWRNSNRK